MRKYALLTICCSAAALAQDSPTYAERLGWNKGDRVVLLHMDDAGMSHDSNAGIVRVLEAGAAKSLSVMMPCPWVPEMVHYMEKHPDTDAGLHLTLTSEWAEYRWGPLSGQPAVPGLVDREGALHRGVAAVVQRATAEEVDREIRAQLDRAERMNFHPSHLDSHMGTLFASPAFLDKYVRLGIEKKIPVMLPGGHDTYIQATTRGAAVSRDAVAAMRKLGDQLWNAGLPVLDDLHNSSYDWKPPAGSAGDEAVLRKWRTRMYIETLRELKPGVTMVIMHCTAPTEVFAKISDSGDLRRADMLAMLDPDFAAFLKREGFIVTTWRELMERRKRVQ